MTPKQESVFFEVHSGLCAGEICAVDNHGPFIERLRRRVPRVRAS